MGNSSFELECVVHAVDGGYFKGSFKYRSCDLHKIER